MIKILITFLILSLIAVSSGCKALKAPSESDILGIRIGMNKDEAAKRLNEIGKLEKEENKQQEVWALNDEPHYSHLIVAFEKENQKVRYITVKARENGSPIRYSDVIDIAKAQQTSSANNHKYIQEVEGNLLAPGYAKIASGKDSNYLTYFSLKELNSSEEEEEDEED